MEIQIVEVGDTSPEHYAEGVLSLCFGHVSQDKRQALDQVIQCPTAHVYVAVKGGDVIGTGTYVLTPHPRLISGMVYDVVVHPAYQGFGVVAKLNAAIKRAAHNDGCACVMASVFDSGEHSTLYEKGWRGNGVKVLYSDVRVTNPSE